MKKLGLLVITLSFAYCSKAPKEIIGVWEVQSKFYQATYKIEQADKKLIGRVIYYNDDTTVLHETGTVKDIFLKDLQYKKNVFIDAVSGATKTTENSLQIKIKHKDTLEVTSFIRNKSLKEIWTRKQQ